MRKRPFSISLLLLLPLFFSFSQDHSVFRGPKKDGIYPGDGLLKKWPASGPDLLWKAENLGNGYSSPVITANRIFVTGEKNGTGILVSLDLHGNVVWEKAYGPEWTVSYPGPRSTPAVAGDQVYLLSGNGNLACFEAESGTLNWSLDLLKDLHGSQVFYGFSESLLIDGDTLYCLPGGADTNVVALNRITGNLLWVSEGTGETAGYVSPVIAAGPTTDLLIVMSEYSICGLEKATGKVRWVHDLKTDLDLTCNYPIADGGSVYYATGPGNGAARLDISPDGNSVVLAWKNPEMDTYFGGFVKVGDFLYGSSSGNDNVVSLDCRTGETVHRLDFFKGALVFSDGMIFIYNERGRMGLISADSGTMTLVGSFIPQRGTREPFAIPVIHKGVLYIRHGDVLMAYDITEN